MPGFDRKIQCKLSNLHAERVMAKGVQMAEILQGLVAGNLPEMAEYTQHLHCSAAHLLRAALGSIDGITVKPFANLVKEGGQLQDTAPFHSTVSR